MEQAPQRGATPPGRLGSPRRRGRFWALMLGLALVTGWISGDGRLQRAYIDQIMARTVRPVPDDIVIVAIDEASLAALGRWPWRRSVHAALLDRLRDAAPRAIGLDLILSEPQSQNPRDDELLREAIARQGRVVLPVHRVQAEALFAVMPLPALQQAAAALGNIDIELDSDGVARGVFLREGTAARHWDHFALALLAAGGDTPPAPVRERLDRFEGAAPAPAGASATEGRRSHWMRLPYAGPPGHFRRVSYLDVLEGRVGAESLRGRYVLVGATAPGMGDAHPTPMGGHGALMPGVEVSAHLLDALLRGVELRRASPLEHALFAAGWMALALLALHRLHPRWAFAAVLGVMTALYATTWLLHARFGVQFVSLWAEVCLALSHPIWSWLRLRAAMVYLDGEFRLARQEAAGAVLAPLPPPGGGDALERRMSALAQAAEQLRQLQRFVTDSLDTLPDAMLVTDAHGTVLLANRAAGGALQRPGGAALLGRPAAQVLREACTQPDGSALPDVLQPPPEAAFERRIGDPAGRDLLLKCVPRGSQPSGPGGWILSLVDISTVQQAQRLREQALRFISHDMRSPQASILALIELQRLHGGPPDAALLERIELHARRTLALADNFVLLARAQSDECRLEELDLCDVVLDALDQHWDRAGALGVELRSELPDDDPGCVARGDRTLLTRALSNLLDNALKYGPSGGVVRCTLRHTPDAHWLAVHDDGPGIAPADQARLFQPFGRLVPGRGPEGAGLGLAFAHAVATRHGGTVALDSAPGRGTTFALRLPHTPPAADATGAPSAFAAGNPCAGMPPGL